MVGGTLEYLSLITGYQFLLIVTGVLYGLALITGRKRIAAQQPAGRWARTAPPAVDRPGQRLPVPAPR